MIKINLLKHSSSKRRARRAPVARIVAAGIAVVCVAAVLTVGTGLVRSYLQQLHVQGQAPAAVALTPAPKPEVPAPAAAAQTQAPKPEMQTPSAAVPAPKTEEPTPTVQAPKPAAKAPAETAAVATAPEENGYTPSTHAQSKMVEDVVNDSEKPGGAKKGTSDLIDLTYGEMSHGEKINYEVAFAKRIVQILARAVPDGIGFSALSIDNFTTVSAAGLGPNRDQVSGLFSALRREHLELLGPPRSYIRSSGSNGYIFLFTCEASFGVNQAEPFLTTDHLEPRENLTTVLRTFAKDATSNGLYLPNGPMRLASEKAGEYRRFTYHITGSGTYRNFVKFVLQVNAEHLPCAFSKVRLKARSDAKLDLAADVVFTMRE